MLDSSIDDHLLESIGWSSILSGISCLRSRIERPSRLEADVGQIVKASSARFEAPNELRSHL
jgi:hypothetical protein